MAQQATEADDVTGNKDPSQFCAGCHECGWATSNDDVIAVDEAAATHEHENNHLTSGPLTHEEGEDYDLRQIP